MLILRVDGGLNGGGSIGLYRMGHHFLFW